MTDITELGNELWNRVKNEADKGFNCPCCNRYVKRYRRKLHAEMSSFLCKLYRADRNAAVTGGLFDARDFEPFTAKASTDATYLVHWGLLLNPKTGCYSITQKGKDFVEGRIRVPLKIHMLCGDLEGFSVEDTSIQESLGSRFNINELMGR